MRYLWKIISIEGKKYAEKYGVTWTFGYSKGGWGSREDKPCFTGEICEACYGEFNILSSAFNKALLFNRTGINKQEVIVKWTITN